MRLHMLREKKNHLKVLVGCQFIRLFGCTSPFIQRIVRTHHVSNIFNGFRDTGPKPIVCLEAMAQFDYCLYKMLRAFFVEPQPLEMAEVHQNPPSSVEKDPRPQPPSRPLPEFAGDSADADPAAAASWKATKYPNPPEQFNPDPVTLRDQWRFAIRQYSRWYSHAWGTAILAGMAFFALGWVVKGSNPLPSSTHPSSDDSTSAADADATKPNRISW
ncbi:hypothetical protein AXF42_Ash005491 [Apostasia shenzhenica]|uniref:Uncharacterized protein n=1 Tax=Apostasia shenzhenica TaxID=1088818 RepID=A0A2I0B728_9ASPA|nr:hypothetical protein AXF42_Ash005491 [Apostasia shenzhenica]